jgi:hypothetical protein
VSADNKKKLYLLVSVVFAFAFCLASQPQSTKLPRAVFPVIARPSADQSDLPGSSGLHLTPGLDRPKTANVSVYDPSEAGLGLVRWEPRSMPILVWISPGLELPECSLAQIKDTRVDLVYQMLKSPGDPFAGLKQAPGWTTERNYQVAAGFEEWRQFEGEGLFNFLFTDDPKEANVFVFFVDTFLDGSAPGGVNVGGNTTAKVNTPAKAHSGQIPKLPVVIELSTLVNGTPEKMIGAAAHEFGHALGIKAHSPYRDDIMYVDRIVDQLSPADKATIRWLYHQHPQMVMY